MTAIASAADASIDAPWHGLQALPRGLWLPAIVTSVGSAERRLADLPVWLSALRHGELPPVAADLGDAQALAPFRAAIGELGLAALSDGSTLLAQQLLRSVAWHLDRIADAQPRLDRDAAIAQAAAAFGADWRRDKGDWQRMLTLLKDFGDPQDPALDQLCGLLRAREWRPAERLVALIAELQPLAELIRRLGRREIATVAPPAADATDQAASPQRRPVRWREIRLADAPGELRGIRHVTRIERMLASEAAQIRHPVLRKLWRADLAEGRLLGHDSSARLLEAFVDPLPQASSRIAQAPPAPRERGPMIVCIDTSGSMRGAPEHVAKAVVIEAMKVAHRSQRGCLLIAFGGPGEIVEQRLEPTAAGLRALLDLVGQAFDGGTDLQAPIARAVERVLHDDLHAADLLLVSDGEFGCTEATLQQLDAARCGCGLRVQGVLVGDRETIGMLEVCDDIHWLRDWRRFADLEQPHREGFVPVHSPSLTALYFPNALSERAARHRRR